MAIIVFILGASLASFVACLAYREIKGVSIFFPYSQCDQCKRKLSFYEKLPILGYIISKGTCRCGYPIKIEYFLSELILAIIFLLYYYQIDSIFYLGFYFFVYLLLAKMSLTDLWTYGVKDRDISLLLLISALKQGHNFFSQRLFLIVAVLQVILIVVAIILNRKENVWIGEGDLLIFAGLASFFKTLGVFYFFAMSFWLALIPAIYLKFRSENKIAMVPFISLSFFINHFFGVVL